MQFLFYAAEGETKPAQGWHLRKLATPWAGPMLREPFTLAPSATSAATLPAVLTLANGCWSYFCAAGYSQYSHRYPPQALDSALYPSWLFSMKRDNLHGMNHAILMVEDNPDDALFVRRQLRNSGLKNDLHVVSDGGEAIKYLTGDGRYSDRTHFPFPCLLLIDLRMPGIDGFSLTAWARNNPQTKDVPVIIYSASPSTEDAERAYALGADVYVAKLPGSRSFDLLFSAIRDFCPVP